MFTSLKLLFVLAIRGAATQTGDKFTLKMKKQLGQDPFPQLAYECNSCTFEQFAAVTPPDANWSKAKAKVILPIGEFGSGPSVPGALKSYDFVPGIPGDDFELIALSLNFSVIGFDRTTKTQFVKSWVQRDTKLKYPAGTRVHEVEDPNRTVFVLFGFEVSSANFSTHPNWEEEDILTKMNYPFPNGWQYTTRVLDNDMLLTGEDGIATVFQVSSSQRESVWQKRVIASSDDSSGGNQDAKISAIFGAMTFIHVLSGN